MTVPRIPGTAAGLPLAAPTASRADRLRQASSDLEGVFVEQLMKVMRETVPEDGLTAGGSGEQMFAGMLDQHLSAEVPKQWHRGLSASLYRDLTAVEQATAAAASTPTPTGEERP